MNAHRPVVAAFDFDGTLTYRDSLLPFIIQTHSLWEFCWKASALVPFGAAFALGLMERQRAKEKLLTCFLGGASVETLLRQAEAFAQNGLPRLVRPEGMERIRWHQQKGHRCILVSASVDLYLLPWAKAMGFDDVISSRLEIRQGVATGRLEGLNCWGPEKTRRLTELLGPKDHYELYAYGDSRGDHELLGLADHSFYRIMPKEEGEGG